MSRELLNFTALEMTYHANAKLYVSKMVDTMLV